MKTIWGIFTFLVLTILFLSFANTIASESSLKNPNLDDESISLIVELEYEVLTYNDDTLTQSDNAITENSSFEGVDAYARQYLEDKSEITQKKTILNKVLGVPDLILKSLGVQNSTLLTSIKLIIVAMITFLIGIAVYKAIRTGETD